MLQNVKEKKMKLFKLIILFVISIIYSQDIFEGYVLFTPGGGGGGGSATTYLKDNNLNNINTWNHSNGAASMPYLIFGDEPGWENTLLVYPYRVNNPTMEAGGVGGAFEVLNWDGELIWEYELSNDDYQHHHDVEPLPNGNILMIAWEKKTATEAYSAGRTSLNGNPLNQMWSSAIFEIAHDGNGGGEVVWEWHLWDHLIQDADPNDENYGVVKDHPELFDINVGSIGVGGPGGANADWMHINAIHYHPEWDQIVISSRYQSEIFVIDHSTTTEEAAGHTGGSYGKGGDFLYRWGNPKNYNRGSEIDQILKEQHSINWIPNGYPGEGNFILFNNYSNGFGPLGESSVLEFVPPVDNDGNYFIEEDQPFGPDSYIWFYDINIFSPFQGGAFRLPNGNTLITDCDSAYILEVTESGNIVWEYSESGNNVAIARAQKYGNEYFDLIDQIIGDLNDDGIINILDIIYIINLILNNQESGTGDLNDDGIINILDIIILSNMILNLER